jgi:hypothetical protein
MTERRITTKEVPTDEWIMYNYIQLSTEQVSAAMQVMLEQGNIKIGRDLTFVPVNPPAATKTITTSGFKPREISLEHEYKYAPGRPSE